MPLFDFVPLHIHHVCSAKPAPFSLDLVSACCCRLVVDERAEKMQIPPASVLKTWPKPNYDSPDTRGNVKIILNIVLYLILVCFMSLRIFTRTYLRKIFGADDILILLAMVCLLKLLVVLSD